MKKAIISVTNDLLTDQRVHKHALSLLKIGYEVELIGRRKGDSQKLENRKYKTKRFKLLFEKGPAFYVEYNLRLFLYLLFIKSDLLVSNDLDTLLPNFLCSRLKNIDLVYDTHEYFTGVPELEGRTFVKNTWRLIEKTIFPKLKNVITVNNSIASLYKKEYGNKIIIIRNIPPKLNIINFDHKQLLVIFYFVLTYLFSNSYI